MLLQERKAQPFLKELAGGGQIVGVQDVDIVVRF